MARIAVVGAGVGGLAAAARLARAGHQVVILEQSGRVGGKLAGYQRDSYTFDTGPSLFTLPAVMKDLFTKTGRRLDTVLDLELLDPAFGYRWADGTAAVLPGIDSTQVAEALGDALGGQTRTEWNAFIRRASDTWSITRGPFLESPLGGPLDLIKHLRRPSDLRNVAPFTSLRRLGEKSFTDPRMVMLLDRYATYAGSDPRRAPAALSVIPYIEQTFGAWHIPGGLHRLAPALHERCVTRGVTVRLDTDVARIIVEGSRVAAVQTTDGERIDVDVVVANADAEHVYGRMLNDPRARAPFRAVQRATPSLAGFVMLLALRGRTPNVQHHQVLFPAQYDDEFDSIFGRRGRAPRPAPDPTIYLCTPNDPLMRPNDDSESMFVLVNAPRHDPVDGVNWTDAQMVEQYAARILTLMAERGVDVRDRIVWREVRTPAILERDTRAPGGSIYGTSSNGAGAAFLRPANQSPVPGLFLVGGSSHPGGGLPLVTLSSAIVADLIGPA